MNPHGKCGKGHHNYKEIQMYNKQIFLSTPYQYMKELSYKVFLVITRMLNIVCVCAYVCVCVCVCVSGQARDLGETVALFQDAPFQPLLHPAAPDLWNVLLHRVLRHSLRLGLHAALVSGHTHTRTYTHTHTPQITRNTTYAPYQRTGNLTLDSNKPRVKCEDDQMNGCRENQITHSLTHSHTHRHTYTHTHSFHYSWITEPAGAMWKICCLVVSSGYENVNNSMVLDHRLNQVQRHRPLN